jgi:hypothetical protein
VTRRTSLLLAALTFALSLGLAAPTTAHPTIGINLGINLGAPPPLVTIPGLPVYYAPTLPYNYFLYGDAYYAFMNEHWYYAPAYNGPWTLIQITRVPPPILSVPVQYYKVPPGHWRESPGPAPWAHQGRGRGHGHDKKAKHHGHNDD